MPGMADESEEQPVAPQPRRPICMDCMGTGTMRQARAMLLRDADGTPEMTSTLVPARCPNCRGTGKAGV